MKRFFYHYDKDTHMAKLTVQHNEGEVPEVTFVTKIICAVATQTERSDVPPKFIVIGECRKIEINEAKQIVYLS